MQHIEAKETDVVQVDFGALLDVQEPASIDYLMIYLSQVDRDGKLVRNFHDYHQEVLKKFSEFNGGATSMAPSQGAWLNVENNEVLIEPTIIVYSFIRPQTFTECAKWVSGFAHRFGRETNQGEVAIQLNDRFYRVNCFREQ